MAVKTDPYCPQKEQKSMATQLPYKGAKVLLSDFFAGTPEWGRLLGSCWQAMYKRQKLKRKLQSRRMEEG
jgi:hypothetical protein